MWFINTQNFRWIWAVADKTSNTMGVRFTPHRRMNNSVFTSWSWNRNLSTKVNRPLSSSFKSRCYCDFILGLEFTCSAIPWSGRLSHDNSYDLSRYTDDLVWSPSSQTVDNGSFRPFVGLRSRCKHTNVVMQISLLRASCVSSALNCCGVTNNIRLALQEWSMSFPTAVACACKFGS